MGKIQVRLIGIAAAAAALALVPGIASARHNAHSKDGTKHCTIKRGFVVQGTYLSGFGTSTITFDVTKRNRHARLAGVDIGDDFAATPTKGIKYVDYEPGEQPDMDDPVRLVGKVEYTKKRCANGGTYGDWSVRKLRVFDND